MPQVLEKKYVSVRRSRAGLGLFARTDIKKGAFVVEYTGDVLTRAEANKRNSRYLFETSANRLIDGSPRSNLARYVNHACEPNCEIEIIRGRVYVVALRDIKAGEELGYDYDTEYFESFITQERCLCHSCS